MIKIEADWIKYNANTKNNNVGDCVKRALSYAYSVDYDEMSRQLNRLKVDMHAAAFNNNRVWRKFVYDHGGYMLPDSEYKGITEGEFASKYPHGVYVCLTGREVDKASHLVCILNGDIIDSWNSSNYLVIEAWEIKDASLDTVEISWEDVEDEVMSYIKDYIASVNKKWSKWFYVSYDEAAFIVDDLTRRIWLELDTKKLPLESKYYSNTTYQKKFIIKLNPRLSVEKNIESLQTQLKGRIYNWIYPFQKDIKDSVAIVDMKTDSMFYDTSHNKKKLLMLPEWCRKYVVDFYIPEDQYFGNQVDEGYFLRMRPLELDNYEENLEFESYSLKGLKEDLERYKRSVEG